MGKSLNDYVDGFFRGVAYVLLDYFYTLFILITRPIRGFRDVLARLAAKNTEQVRPHLFLFLSFALLLSVVPAFDVIWEVKFTSADPNQAESFLGRLYAAASKAFDNNHLFPMITSSFAMVLVVDIAVRGGAMIIANPIRRHLFKQAAFFVVGLQTILLIAVSISTIWARTPEWGDSYMSRQAIGNVFSIPYQLFVYVALGHYPFLGYWLPCMVTAALVAIEFAPLPMLWRFISRRRNGTFLVISAIAALIVFDIGSTLIIRLGNYGASQISYRELPYFTITDAKCYTVLEGKPRIEAFATIRNDGAYIYRIKQEELKVYLSAERISSDPQPPKRHSSRPPRKAYLTLKAVVENSSFGSKPEVLFLEPKRNYWFKMAADLDNDALQFVRTHREERMCTVEWPNPEVIIASSDPLEIDLSKFAVSK